MRQVRSTNHSWWETPETNDDKYSNSGIMTRAGNCMFSFTIILLQDRFANTVGIILGLNCWVYFNLWPFIYSVTFLYYFVDWQLLIQYILTVITSMEFFITDVLIKSWFLFWSLLEVFKTYLSSFAFTRQLHDLKRKPGIGGLHKIIKC